MAFRKIKYTIYLFGLSTFFMLSFIPAKYSANFKKDKKEIDTLTIFNSFAHIVANNNREEYTDSILAVTNQKLIDSVTIKLLHKKYTLERELIPQLNIDQFTGLFDQLENSSNTLNNVSATQLLNNLSVKCKSKYALLLVYQSQYHPEFPPHYKLHTAVLNSTIVVTPKNPTKSTSDLRLMVIETESEKIVFYDRIDSSLFDPRIESEVVQITKNILKTIYYK